MKKISLALLFLFLTVGFLAVPVSAKTYEENGLRYQVKNRKAILIGDDGGINTKDLVIPAALGGFQVTEISSEAFRKSSYTSITLPDTITAIGVEAFADSKELKSIKLPAKLKRVETYAFSGCTALTSVQFNSKLESIGRKSFSNCISLTKVTLPNAVTSIGDRAFEKCYKLNSVKLNKKLTKIGEEAFYKDYALKSIHIPSKVTVVKDGAFKKCEDLTSVKFDNAKTKLGTAVFYQCISLKKAVLPKSIKTIPESTFSGCTKLSKVAVPKDVSLIKRKAFYGCTALKTVTMNKKIYAVGDRAFAYSGLQNIKLNQNMQFIGNGAFQSTKIQNFELKSKVTFIGNRVFADCKKLKTISIPASVKGINPGAFNNCISLRAINVASGNKNYCSEAGVLYDKNKTKLIQYPLHKMSKSFRTPGSLQRIRSKAFSGNPYLQNVTISSNSIGDWAFYEMERLQSVTILNGTTKIGRGAFQENASLQKVSLPDSVTSIGQAAFAGSSIRRIHIPSRLTKLGTDAFYGCRQISAFEGGRGSKYKVVDGVLYNGSMTELIKYPAKKSTKVFSVPDSVRKVKWEAFEYVSKLTKLEFGKNLRTLQYHAIYKAKNLKSIVFNSSKLSYDSLSSVIDCNKLAVIVGPNTYVLRALAQDANATLITL